MTTSDQDKSKDVALAVLTNLIRLMGAELVAGRHRDDLDLFETAMRGRFASALLPTCSTEVAEAGLQLAGRCIEQALAQVRAQAKAVQDQADKRGKVSLH